MSIFALSDSAFLNYTLASMLADEIVRRNGKVAYISSAPQPHPRTWFQNTADEYRSIDSRISLEYFDLSDSYSTEKLYQILEFGTVHLSGGNSFEFLSLIRERSFRRLLKLHLDNDGLVVGVSAGSIVLTPTVATAYLAGDKKVISLKDYTGLSLLPFEFYPHFQGSQVELDNIARYSKTTTNAIYVCKDCDGILFENNLIRCMGDVLKIYNGKIYEPVLVR